MQAGAVWEKQYEALEKLYRVANPTLLAAAQKQLKPNAPHASDVDILAAQQAGKGALGARIVAIKERAVKNRSDDAEVLAPQRPCGRRERGEVVCGEERGGARRVSASPRDARRVEGVAGRARRALARRERTGRKWTLR